MNKPKAFRSLMIEQLESRCLLASGWFGQTFDQQVSEPNQVSIRPQSIEHRLGDGRDNPSQDVDGRSSRGSDSVRDASSLSTKRRDEPGRPTGVSNHEDRSFDRPNNVPSLTSAASTSQSLFQLFPPSTRSSSQPSVIETRGPESNQVADQSQGAQGRFAIGSDLIASQLQGASLSADRDLTVQSTNTSESFAGATEFSANQFDASNANIHQGGSADDDPGALPLMDFEPSDRAERLRPNDEVGGAIEILPLLRRELRAPQETGSEFWKLDARSIERIREISDQPDDSSNSVIDKNTDVVIASWFNQETGLMEIQANGRLQTPVDAVDSLVEVVLAATVGMHRSVDLIATVTPENETVRDEIRGAILAAIAHEQSLQLPDQMVHRSAIHVSAIVHPCVALVATGLSLAARRKRIDAKMHSSGDNPAGGC
jgi:hypothetical protein